MVTLLSVFKRAIGGAILCLLLGPLAAAQSIEVESIGRRLNVDDWEQQEIGRLRWRGGLELRSESDAFGGFSGLQVLDEGRRLLAVTDQGHWLEAKLFYDEDGWLTGLASANVGPLHDETGSPLADKSHQDAEGLARLSDGSFVVAFERRHRMLRYKSPDGLRGPAYPFAQPRTIADLPANKGLEALTAWPDGRIFAAAEARRDDGNHAAYLFENGRWESLTLVGVERHRPTGAAALPNGDLILVERRFSTLGGLSIRLRLIPQRDLRAGATLVGEEVARLAPPLTVDNMEAVAAWRDRRGRTLVALLSDDNFSPLQRTLLLLFELVD